MKVKLTRKDFNMRQIIKLSVFIFIVFLSFLIKISIQADDQTYDAVYFGSYNCLVCQSLEETGVLEDIKNDGYDLQKYMSEDDYDLFESMFSKYAQTYNVPKNINLVPILYAGDQYYAGVEAIVDAVESGEIYQVMDNSSLLDVTDILYDDLSLENMIVLISSTIVLGFLDAFNPCALAMLLMFLSFLTTKERSKTIALLCVSYISAVFITYFVLGTILQKILTLLVPYMNIFYVLIIVLALFISMLNFLDFLSSRKKEYGKIKNQLPKGIFKITNKILSSFSSKIEKGDRSIYFLSFFIGVFVAVVEFPCSGQAFVAWTAIVVDRSTHLFIFYMLLLSYVFIFVSPLIIISYLSLKSKSIRVISSFIRKKMDIIKLFNAIIFFAVAIYYIVHVYL
jgi:cytochrome c biogenesis protein CcdA